MSKLFIAEKPSLGKAIAGRLKKPHKRGNGYIETAEGVVTWCFGHMFEQPGTPFYVLGGRKPKAGEKVKWDKNILPIVPKKWALLPKKDCKDQLSIIKGLLGKCTSVVNAGDPDREGQLLIDELLEEYKYKGKTERIWLNAIDPTSVDRALNSMKPNSEYANLRDEAKARSRADWLLGMNLTQSYTLANKHFGSVISIGRVQTPTLSLIAKRDNEIDNFTSIPFFLPFIDVEHNKGSFRAFYKPSKTTKLDSAGRIVDKQVATDIIDKVKNKKGNISAKKVETKREQPPLPFSLSTVQKEASSKFGFGAKDTLDIIQVLYEKHEAVSYPRSDCEFLPMSQYDDSPKVLANIEEVFPSLVSGADKSLKSRAFNDSKVSAHHGIVPTLKKVNMNALNPNEKKMYELICRNYAAQFYNAYKYEQTSIGVNVDGETFVARGKVEKDKGWKVIVADSGKKKSEVVLPDVSKDDDVIVDNASATNKKTTPPARFTEGTLIDAMTNIHRFVDDKKSADILKKSKGIGTVATRAGIIETLFSRKFVEKKGKAIVSTQSGKKLVSQLQDELKNPVTTAAWEMKLEHVGSGNISLDNFVDEIVSSVVDPLCSDMKTKVLDIELNQKGNKFSKSKKSYPKKTNSSYKKTTKAAASTGYKRTKGF